jgi:hypothetical protein
VVLPGQTRDDVPDFLAPATTTVYFVREFTVAGAEPLLRLLTRQPAHIPSPLGPRLVLPSYPPPRSGQPFAHTPDTVSPQRTPDRPLPPVASRRRRRRLWAVGAAIVVVVAITIATTNTGNTNRPGALAATEAPVTTTGAVKAAIPRTSTLAPSPVTAPSRPSTFSGRGDDVITINRPDGVKIIRFACPHCGGNTILLINGAEYLLVDTIGPYSGQQWADVQDGSNTTKITITADSAWTLVVGGIDLARTSTGAVSGHGDDVLLLNANTSQAAITNQGNGNFIVQDVSPSGGSANLDVDTIGSYQGTVPLTGPALVQIKSDGSWSVDPS